MLTATPQTKPTLLTIESDAEFFDIVEIPSGKVFWEKMDKETVLRGFSDHNFDPNFFQIAEHKE